MTSPQHEKRAEAHFKKLTVQERKTTDQISQALRAKHRSLVRKITPKWEAIRSNEALLPHQKAMLLRAELGDINIANKNWNATFRALYGIVDNTALDTATNMVRLSQGEAAGKISSRDQIIDFWIQDSSQRMQRWGREYENQATGLFELAFQQDWSASKVSENLHSNLGRLERNAARIVRTSSNAVSNQAIKQVFDSNNVDYVLWSAFEDDKICPYCSARNGLIYRIGEAYVPAHVNCRCVLLPIKKEWIINGKFDKNWAKESRAKGLDELKKAGGAPNYAATPFEKSKGLQKSPNPVWNPDRGFSKGEKPARITKPQLKYLSLSELKALARSSGLTDAQVKKLGKTSLAKRDTWIRAISKSSRF